MEILNKNWFAFTLIAVIFGVLGFLVGRQGNPNCCSMKKGPHEVMFTNGHESTLMIDNVQGVNRVKVIDLEKHQCSGGEGKTSVKVTPQGE
jgi:hypothetical protein